MKNIPSNHHLKSKKRIFDLPRQDSSPCTHPIYYSANLPSLLLQENLSLSLYNSDQPPHIRNLNYLRCNYPKLSKHKTNLRMAHYIDTTPRTYRKTPSFFFHKLSFHRKSDDQEVRHHNSNRHYDHKP